MFPAQNCPFSFLTSYGYSYYYRYLRDGLATTKSDVYAFGVILFELISGKEALTRTEAVVMKNSERRSLASIVSLFDKSFMASYISLRKFKVCILHSKIYMLFEL